MKGAVLIALNEMIEERYGLEVWEKLLQIVQPKSGGIYTSVGNYADEEIFAYVKHLSDILNMDGTAILRAFGEYIFPVFNKKFPVFTKIQPDFFSFIMSIEGVIHKEVCKLYEDANLPTLNCQKIDENNMSVEYRSPRKLCFLAEGLIAGVASYYQVKYQIDHVACMHDGADHCLLRITTE